VSEQPVSPAPRRVARWALYLPYILLLVLAAGVSAFWFIARDRVDDAVDAWLTTEAGRGRQWTCPDRALSGFPLRFEISCTRPTFDGQLGDGRRVQGEMASFRAVAQIYDPNLVVLDFTGPVTVREEGRPETLRLGWEGFSLSVRRTANAFSRLSAYMKKPVLAALDSNGGETLLGRAEAWEAHVRPDPAAAAGDREMWDVASQLVKATSPVADALLGNPAPANVELQAGLDHAGVFVKGAGPAQIDAWRAAGGRLKVALLKLTRGDQIIEARGELGVDDLRRLSGQLDVKAAGVSELLARLTGRRGGMGGLLAGGLAMLGGGQGAQRQGDAADGQPPAPPLTPMPPLVFAEGRLMIGPFPVMRLPPLY